MKPHRKGLLANKPSIEPISSGNITIKKTTPLDPNLSKLLSMSEQFSCNQKAPFKASYTPS